MRRVVSTPRLSCMSICLDQQLWSTITVGSLQVRYTRRIYYAPQKSFAARAVSSQPTAVTAAWRAFPQGKQASHCAAHALKHTGVRDGSLTPALRAPRPPKSQTLDEFGGN